MFEGDLRALKEIMDHSNEPLVDMSKFPFFGGKNCHKWANSLTSFATDTFAKRLAEARPRLAAALKSFNDEFNVHLIDPNNDKLFKGSKLTEEETDRFAKMRRKFNQGGQHA